MQDFFILIYMLNFYFCISYPFIRNNMYIILNKKKNKQKYIILCFYLFFLFSAVFHSHNINFTSLPELSNVPPTSRIADPLLDGTNCILTHFFQSQIFEYQCSADLKFILSYSEYSVHLKNDWIIKTDFLSSQNLRAPPFLNS